MPHVPSMSADELPGLGRLGEYQLLEKLGQGGMGTVYKALHTELDRVVALKVLSPEALRDEQAAARFKREMKAVGQLDHPHIVRAHDAREIDGTQVLVMEYVDGEDLGQLSARRGPLPIGDACELVRQAALGLQSAHDHGLVHRDIKPANLILSREGRVKILDLGLARLANPETNPVQLTATGFTVGTPDYIAPEQLSDSHAVDARSDLYSLGCTLYQLLAGQPPFHGPQFRNAFDKLWAHVSRTVPPIRERRPEVSVALASVLERMLAKEPAARWATAAEVAQALDPFSVGSVQRTMLLRAEGRTLAAPYAPPVSPSVKPRAESRWRRGWWLRAGGLLLLGIAGASLAWRDWQPGTQPLPPPEAGPSLPSEPNVPTTVQAPLIPPPPIVDPTSLPGWIVLTLGGPGLTKTHLWLVRPDGEQRLALTGDSGYFESHPRFSPDGRRVAMIRGELSGNRHGLWTCRVDGSELRPCVWARTGERLLSPVWVSDTRLCYTTVPRIDRLRDMQVWEVDLGGGLPEAKDPQPHPVFGFHDAQHDDGGLVTDVSPNGRYLAVLIMRQGLWDTTDVVVTDRSGKRLFTVWEDFPEARKDGRTLWSPQGDRIAWHHNFTPTTGAGPARSGAGLARLGPGGQWRSELPSDHESAITPLAWSPDGRWVLCARFADGSSQAQLFLMDDLFRSAGELFELEAGGWQASQRDFSRLADWAVLPADASLPVGE